MLVSLRWLARYLDLPDTPDALANRLALSGLNHEGTIEFDGDTIFDLEVTSNRGDCLGHLGVAREIAALYDIQSTRPEVHTGDSAPHGPPIGDSLSIDNQFADACPRYTARLVRGVAIGPSPGWMIDDIRSAMVKQRGEQFETYNPINNVVDASNYVMLECGQPLHAFDHAKLSGGGITVRPGRPGETITAIDHREYELTPSDCVIADQDRAAAIAGVMGGSATEVDDSTTDVVIESAIFTPLSVRRTARRLKLQSPSSFRYERRVDPVGVDWASRRLCDLIVQTGGGIVADGVLDTASDIAPRQPVRWKWSDLRRILGIDIDQSTAIEILSRLGCDTQIDDGRTLTTIPPTWRHDLTRGADLIEEVARIHGYDKIPENAPISVTPSRRRVQDDAVDRIRGCFVAAGLSEAMTPSVVTESIDATLSPITDAAPLRTLTPMLKGARTLRRSIIPSLLESRARNWSTASIEADLFEIAHVYLPDTGERYAVTFVIGDDFRRGKGIIESLLDRLGAEHPLTVDVAAIDGMLPGRGVKLSSGGRPIGVLGCIDPKRVKSLKLPTAVVAAELSLPALLSIANLVPTQRSVSTQPSVTRDLNFIIGEAVRWADLETAARATIGDSLADLRYVETYRDPASDGPNTKRVLLAVELQRPDATLTGGQASGLVDQFVERVATEHDGKLVG